MSIELVLGSAIFRSDPAAGPEAAGHAPQAAIDAATCSKQGVRLSALIAIAGRGPKPLAECRDSPGDGGRGLVRGSKVADTPFW